MKLKQPFAAEDKTELAVMQVLSWAHGHYRKQADLEPRQLPAGYAQHYPEYPGDRACGDRQYPTGSEPLVIYLPQPAHDFGNEMSTNLPESLGLPWGNNYQRRSAPWLTKGVLHRKVPERFPIRLRGEWRGWEDLEEPDATGDDLVTN